MECAVIAKNIIVLIYEVASVIRNEEDEKRTEELNRMERINAIDNTASNDSPRFVTVILRFPLDSFRSIAAIT